MSNDGAQDIIINEEVFEFLRPLGGRGQAGMAGFYKSQSSQKEYLIKEDNPGTCLAESTAIVYDPTNSSRASPIIQAQIATMDKNGQLISVSIQQAFTVDKGDNEHIKSLDVVLLGHKRAPKTWVSEEAYAQTAIKEKLSTLSDDVKKQLAYAIYTSQLNGDESLHTGQFMVTVNNDSNAVTSIKRIDFGALGRYGMARDDFDPLHTSKKYARSGQWGKDYVAYLLQDPSIASQVIELWKKTDARVVADQIVDRFNQQLENISDPNLRKSALLEFGKSLLKNSSFKLASDLDLIRLETQMILHVHAAALKRAAGYTDAAMKYAPIIADLTEANINKFKEFKHHYDDEIPRHSNSDTAPLSDDEERSSPHN